MPEKPEHKNGLLYAETVLVPVANPKTARELLQLGLALAHPEEGRVIALTVTLGETEKEAKTLDEIEPICDSFTANGQPVELQTRTAPNIARGILDTAREENADLIILGINKPNRSAVVIGAIAENVATTAPCDVLIYRSGEQADFQRIVVPVNGSEHSRIAARVGVQLGAGYDRPVEAMYVQSSEEAYWRGRGQMEEALREVPGANTIKRTLLTAHSPTSGILARVDENDLLVVGYARRSEMQRWLYGDFSRDLLNRAPGGVVLTAQLAEPESDDGLVQRFWRWLRPTLTRVEQEELVRQAQGMAATSLDFSVLIVIAAVLATFGLLTSSPAVIIGAMLVAPLMSPLIAFSVGMTTGRVRMVRRSALTVVVGFALAVMLAIVVGAISPTKIITSEMAARGNPTVLDMGVALASGFIGAYATARKDIPAALAGVAIAAALVPPVCTIGLGLAYANTSLARGATLLFATNIVSIILAAWVVFFWLGLRPQVIEESRGRQYISAAMVLVFAGILAALLLRDVNPNTFEAGIEDELRAAFRQDELLDFEVRRSDPLQVIATVRRSARRLDDNSEVIEAQQALQARLEQAVNLDVVVEPYYNAEALLIEQMIVDTLNPAQVTVNQITRSEGTLMISLTVEADAVETVRDQYTALETALHGALEEAVVLMIQTAAGERITPPDVLPEATVEASG